MSSLRNSVQLIGHMGIDPEVRTLENGIKVARLRMATKESYKNKSGGWSDETTWHNIVAWEALAERAEKLLSKGSYVLLEGKLTNRSYVDAKGEKRYVYEIRATNFILLDKREQSSFAPADDAGRQEEDSLPF